MNKNNNSIPFNPITLMVLVSMFYWGCGGGGDSDLEDIPQDEKIVSEQTTLYNIDNKVFFIPNPVQTSLLVKDIASPYNKDLLNSANNIENYTTSFKQAVNLGVYGADLGYITSNGQNQQALTHLGAVKTLADQLGVTSAFDFGEIESFGQNVGNEQEMLSFITSAYKTSQEFLEDNSRHDIAALLMAGAMVEGLFLAVSHTKEGVDNHQVAIKVAEQSTTLDNIILMLNPHYSSNSAPELSAFVDKLMDLQTQLKSIKTEYSFEKSTIDAENKTCKINSKNIISINEKSLHNIGNKIKIIRESITS
jgi:hypothetical protein